MQLFNMIVTAGWSGDDGVDGDDLPSPGRNFPGKNLSVGELFLSRYFPTRRGGRNVSAVAPRVLGF